MNITEKQKIINDFKVEEALHETAGYYWGISDIKIEDLKLTKDCATTAEFLYDIFYNAALFGYKYPQNDKSCSTTFTGKINRTIINEIDVAKAALRDLTTTCLFKNGITKEAIDLYTDCIYCMFDNLIKFVVRINLVQVTDGVKAGLEYCSNPRTEEFSVEDLRKKLRSIRDITLSILEPRENTYFDVLSEMKRISKLRSDVCRDILLSADKPES